MSKKLKKFLNDAEKTESKIAELEEYLRNVRAAQKRKRTMRSFGLSAAQSWVGVTCWHCWKISRRGM